ncbi:NAD(P)H-dependent oxidoreductase [Limosilactobacillus sp. STM2_1]|uniref:NAD(P)H-dependent oxidoreductase n=1 Tax=Limosilactobacillus rudii TaxID=2759755 RepID=A0A7W3YNJ5_9LACO|nr:NAD(P)H-dependent oxidoreductase [Limosilactobacillus rudii]MBB1079336.1 NAD(P)H-dependent oxidoreductase [Limosilactobacillus rudii]MBB1097382.1 NAD(P)H-dependent oxidoreductase [Limosilactobacillus rudii]MCD7134491.1 NAD(P)H-dependent oxidoreductase [Limosilactobacillus rudii]
MKTLVVVAHPQIENSATEAFLKTAASFDENVTWHQLATPFDIKREQSLLSAADRIIFQFPMYWYSAPAILKEWLDKVWDNYLVNNHLVTGRELGIVVTVGHAASSFQPGASQQYTIAELLRPYEALAHNLGLQYLPAFPIYQFDQQSDEQRQLLFICYQQYLAIPKLCHFKDEVKWFADRLEKKIANENDPVQRAKIEQLLLLLNDQQDELDDLYMSVKWLREKEDY